MSAKVVVPPRIISSAASRVPQRTKSSVTFLASAGKMYFVSHSSSVTSSFSPRSRVIGACVCPLISPGRISFPCAWIRRGAVYFASISARLPTATIASPFTAMAPSSMIRLSPSIVTIVPPAAIKSARSFAEVFCPRAGPPERRDKTGIRKILIHLIGFFMVGVPLDGLRVDSQMGGIKRFRKQRIIDPNGESTIAAMSGKGQTLTKCFPAAWAWPQLEAPTFDKQCQNPDADTYGSCYRVQDVPPGQPRHEKEPRYQA